jgi:hypothetical protein
MLWCPLAFLFSLTAHDPRFLHALFSQYVGAIDEDAGERDQVDSGEDRSLDSVPVLDKEKARACYALGILALWKVNRASPTQPT